MGQATAEKLDLATMTCQQFTHADAKTNRITLAWIEGYYKADGDRPVIDTEKFERDAKKLSEYCAKNPSIELITAADHLLE